MQKQVLCGDAAMEETDIGHKSTCKYFDVPVVWVEDIRLLPQGEMDYPSDGGWLLADILQKRIGHRLYLPMSSSTRFPSTPLNLFRLRRRTSRSRL